MSEVKTNKISPATGTAFTLGDSGDTFTVPSGASIVNSGTATGFGTAGLEIVKVGFWEDTTRRTGSGDDVTWCTDIDIFTKVSATSHLLINGDMRGLGATTNDITIPVATFYSGSVYTFEIIAGFRGNAGHVAACNPFVISADVGGTGVHKTSGSGSALPVGSVYFKFETTGNASSNDSWNTMNPNTSDGGRFYASDHARAFNTQFTIIEYEPS